MVISPAAFAQFLDAVSGCSAFTRKNRHRRLFGIVESRMEMRSSAPSHLAPMPGCLSALMKWGVILEKGISPAYGQMPVTNGDGGPSASIEQRIQYKCIGPGNAMRLSEPARFRSCPLLAYRSDRSYAAEAPAHLSLSRILSRY